MPLAPTLTPIAPSFTFFLGAKTPRWLNQTDVPLFLAYPAMSRLSERVSSSTVWALDSGGFTELSLYGRWTVSPGQYAAHARWFYDNIPGMQWAACQDWVCQPFITEKTGLSVAIHQQRTVASYLRLRELQPSVPWAPVLQGWCIGEYIDHVRQYEEAGIDLTELPIVGIGSIAARQHKEADYVEALIREVANIGIKLHGFGLKKTGLKRYAHLLTSADSIAWAMHARLARMKLPDCTHIGKDCSSCLTWALQWRKEVLEKVSIADKRRPLSRRRNDLITLQRPTNRTSNGVPNRATLLAKGYHSCEWPGCEELIAPTVFFCPQHWAVIPSDIRRKIVREYAPNRWVDGKPPRSYVEAMDLATQWIEDNYDGESVSESV